MTFHKIIEQIFMSFHENALQHRQHLSKPCRTGTYYLLQTKVQKLKIFNKGNNAGKINILAKKPKMLCFWGWESQIKTAKKCVKFSKEEKRKSKLISHLLTGTPAVPRKKRTNLRTSLDGETVNIYLARTQSGASILSGTECVSRLLVGEPGTATVAPGGGNGSIQYQKPGDLYARRMSRPLNSQLLTNGHHRLVLIHPLYMHNFFKENCTSFYNY
jgi:hypothetical protein